jgi:hypothetical protein
MPDLEVSAVKKINWEAEVEDKSKVVAKLTGLARKLTSFIKTITPTSSKAVRYVSATKLVAGLPGLFAIRDFFKSLVSVYREKGRKPRTFVDLIDQGHEVVHAAVDMAEGLKSAKAVTEEAIAWTKPIGTYLLPLEVISLSTSIYDAWGTAKAKKHIDHLPIAQGRMEKRAATADMALKWLTSRKTEKSLGKRLGLAPTCSIAKKVEDLRARLRVGETRKAAVEESEGLLKALKSRVSKKLTWEVLGVVTKVFACVCTVLLLLSPLSPLLLGLSTLAALVGTGIYLWKRYSIPKVMPELIKV